MEFDRDLVSIQEARSLALKAYEAQKIWAKASQEQVDHVCSKMAEAAYRASERLGTMAHEETGFGVAAHKKIKNEFASRIIWESIKDVKTVGVIHEDRNRHIYEIAWPAGVVVGLTPSTNPTSTVMAKVLMAVKARDAIIIAPHPSAAKCSYDTVALMATTAVEAGAPEGLISCMKHVSLEGTQALMSHKRVALILATGGSGMVKAAHSVGKPAYGVGPGNVPVYVDRSADIKKAARYIVSSKAFDHSTICATEQAVVADKPISYDLAKLMEAQGAYFVSEAQADLLRNLLFNPDRSINNATVGKSAHYLAAMAGFKIPDQTRVLVARLNKVGREEPLSREKLTTVLGWYVEDGWEDGCERSIELINYGGRGHTQIIYAKDENVIMQYGLEKPVFRILVNTMGTLGAIGFTTGVIPSMTLGSGMIGGSITGDNVSVHHLFNVKRLAYEIKSPPESIFKEEKKSEGLSPQEIERVVIQVIEEILNTTTN